MLNASVGWLLARLLDPFASLPPLVGLTVVSLVTAAGLLAAFKWTSNQRAITATKRQIHAGFFELRLFQEDPLLVLRAVGGLLRQQGRYLRYALVPLLWVSVPLSVLLAHLQTYYGYAGLRPGDRAVVIVRLARASAAGAIEESRLTLDAPPGLRVETPCVWVPGRLEGAWRIAGDREGNYELRVTWSPNAAPSESAPAAGVTTFTKRVRVTDAIVERAAVRPASSLVDQWLHPAEPPLPADAPIEAITVRYPERTIELLGFSLPWLLVFLMLTTIFMLLGRSLLHVVI